jgi:hypothetical protein
MGESRLQKRRSNPDGNGASGRQRGHFVYIWTKIIRHCEERSDEAIQFLLVALGLLHPMLNDHKPRRAKAAKEPQRKASAPLQD